MTAIADGAGRIQALDPQRSFIVQAPAGSGKTELLTQRLLALLGTASRPEEILAITFTRKAAAEMRHRLLQALESADGPRPEAAHQLRTWELARQVQDRDRELGWDLLGTPARLSIQTIDSFNAWLIRRMPWMSRFGAVPDIAEDPTPLLLEAVRRTLDRVSTGDAGGAAGALLLRHLDNRMEKLADMLVAMLNRRDQWLRHLVGNENDDENLKELLEKCLSGYVAEVLTQGRDQLPENLWPAIAAAGRYAADTIDPSRPMAALAGLTDLPGADPSSLPVWKGLADLFLTTSGTLRKIVNKTCGFPAGEGKDRKKAMERLLLEPDLEPWVSVLEVIRRLPSPCYPVEQWQVLQALLALLKLAVAELWLVFSERGQTDFAEIAMRALDALGGADRPSELLLRLDARINHILVDEFQDTSYLQYALLTRLVEGWEPGDGRTLFLVGDPMQSIYRFREAEVGLFLKAQQSGIGNVPLEPLRLVTNFRSGPGIVDWINAAFSGIFPSQEDVASGAVRYSPAVPFRSIEEGPSVSFHPNIGRSDEGEARKVVELAREALESGDSSVAILVRSRAHLQGILPALRSANLAYLCQDIDLLHHRQAALDLVALTRAILHPADRHSWLAVLRAPWCGLTLRDIHALCGGNTALTVPELLSDPAVLKHLTESGQTRIERTRQVLRHGYGQRGRVGLRRLVEGCWLSLGGPACYDKASREDARRVLDLIESLEAGGDLPALDALGEGLGRLYSAPDTGADGKLQIMTIHKAKGLEFDTVILPGLGRSPGRTVQPLLRWLEHPVHGLLLAPIAPSDGSKDPLYQVVGRLEQEKDSHETTRLVYVATTRARRQLHLLGHADAGAEGELKPAPGSLLEKIWPIVGVEFAGSKGCEERTADTGRNGSSVRLYRLPLGWALPDPGAQVVARRSRRQAPSHAESTEEYAAAYFAGLASRHAGTVTHVLLERICREGLATWTPERIFGLRDEVNLRLLREGVPRGQAEPWAEKIVNRLGRVVSSDRGRWILAPRAEGAVELAVTGADGTLGVIDRTFVENGIRWIIDYKTSEPGEKDLMEQFLRRERDRYRMQLLAYREFFRGLEPERTHRAALFFPSVDAFVEVDS